VDAVLTFDEIKARYAPAWVLLGDPQTDEFQQVHGGRVLFQSADREEVYRKAIELQPGHFAFCYLGEWPEDLEFILRLATDVRARQRQIPVDQKSTRADL
jgi:hypothetical protein